VCAVCVCMRWMDVCVCNVCMYIYVCMYEICVCMDG
jgi:hypothetical protein